MIHFLQTVMFWNINNIKFDMKNIIIILDINLVEDEEAKDLGDGKRANLTSTFISQNL